MGKSSPKAPAAPDPVLTAQAQGQANRDTAITQFNLNAFDQVNPFGTLRFNQIGTWADGTPRYQSVSSLAPEEQKSLDFSRQARDIYNQTALDQFQMAREKLSRPVDFSNNAIEGRLIDLGRRRLDPMLTSRREAQDLRLRQQGLMPGTEAYEAAMKGIGEAENDAYNQLLLTGRRQGIDEMLAERSVPLNEVMALISGQQVRHPDFMGIGNTNVGMTDTMMAQQQQQNALNAAYQAKVGTQNANTSGMYGLGSAAITAAAVAASSDRRLKREIRRIGTWMNGLPVYVWRYIWGGPLQIGFMADEVAQVHPEAVLTGPGGYAMVRYDLAVR